MRRRNPWFLVAAIFLVGIVMGCYIETSVLSGKTTNPTPQPAIGSVPIAVPYYVGR